MIRIDTDAGVSGYGESGVTGSMMKAWLEVYRPLLIKQDPLAIQYHLHRMSTLMHTYMARIPALSGIDMALWDLAGRLRGEPVYKLLGGPFRDQVPMFINTEPADMLDKAAVKDWADQFRQQPLGFKAVKMNTTSVIQRPAGRYTTALSAQDLHKIRTGFRERPPGTGAGLRHHGPLPQRVRPAQRQGHRPGRRSHRAQVVRGSAPGAVLRQLGVAEARMPRAAADRRETARCPRATIRS